MSTLPSTLETLLAKANANVRLATERLKLAEASKLEEAIRPVRQKFNAASETRDALQSLLTASEGSITRQMEDAAVKHGIADKLAPQSPAKAKTIRRMAVALEKGYRLWCDHHGKLPQPLASFAPKVKASPKEEPKPTGAKGGHGGKRDGAGRPALGHVQLLFKCSPKTAEKARKLAKAKDITLGGWLDSIIDSIQ